MSSRKNRQDHKKKHGISKKNNANAVRGQKSIVRPQYSKGKFRHWMHGESSEWLKDDKLKAVFFLDQCMDRISLRAITDNLPSHVRVLQFPGRLTHAYDVVVLRTVMDFLINNKKLLSDNIKICFFTRDEKFAADSNSEQIFKEYGFRIDFLIMRWSLICIREIKEKLAKF